MKWIGPDESRAENYIPYYTFGNLENAGFKVNAFTTKMYRKHGEMNDFLQLLKRSDSVPYEVEECRKILLDQFGTDRDHLVPSAQKHTSNIHVVTDDDLGPESSRKKFESIDGLVTDRPGVMLQTFGADCPSVFLADPQHRAIGLCHSGRKGTQQHIASVMLEIMCMEYSSDPARVLAAISPGICVSCYEVGTDVALDFSGSYYAEKTKESALEAGLDDGILKLTNGRYHIDLTRSIMLSLTAAGVPEENIEKSDICTKCRPDILFSFRGQGCITNENSAVFMI